MSGPEAHVSRLHTVVSDDSRVCALLSDDSRVRTSEAL